MGEQRATPALLALDVVPDRAVLGPAGALAVLRGGPTQRQRPAVPVADDLPGDPVGRSGLGPNHSGPGEVADDRARRVLGIARAGEPGEVGDGDVIAPVEAGPAQALTDPFEHAVLDAGALDEEHVERLVLLLGEQQAAGGPPVAAGAPDLLVVGLQRGGHCGVGDRPHVGFIDPHPERVRRDDDRHLARHEPFLGPVSNPAIKPGVVGERLDAELTSKLIRQLLARRPRPGIDDRRQRIHLAERRRQPAPFVDRVAARHDGQHKVRPVKPGRHSQWIAQGEPADDVGRDGGRRRRGERERCACADRLGGLGKGKVVRSKVVAPLRDAVRLVDDEQPHARAGDCVQEARKRKPLWRDVQHPHLVAADDARQCFSVPSRAALRIDQLDLARRDPPQRARLVLHE